MPPLHRKILFIDAYDSFSNSIIALLRAELPVTVNSVKIDDERFVLNDEAFFDFLHGFDAVVAGPGPGHPGISEDVGLIGKLWRLPDEHRLPVLGICLGFQSLCLAFGGHVGRLREPRHGITAVITHCGADIFAGAGKVTATQYHSLHVQLEGGSGEDWKPRNLWQPSQNCPRLIPLAWDLLNVVNGPVLMAARHREHPFWGVQYHPESICTNEEGKHLIGEWWENACSWNSMNKRSESLRVPKFNGCWSQDEKDWVARKPSVRSRSPSVSWLKCDSGLACDVADLVEHLRTNYMTGEPLLLESGVRDGNPINSETGRFSIIGLPDSKPAHIRYFTNGQYLEVLQNGGIVFRKQSTVGEALAYIDGLMQDRKASDGPPESPFWGGLVGFIAYEAGLESIEVMPVGARADRPDTWFVFVERSIVVDHVKGDIYIQSVRENDDDWLQSASMAVKRCSSRNAAPPIRPPITTTLTAGPTQREYCQKVLSCQAQLRAGESYELCLTDQSTIQTSADSWSLYHRLRSRNPAPFGAHLRLQVDHGPGISIAGSSPERFLSWSRKGKCQFRPIKGTVKKGPGVTRAKAEELLGSAKERAENLMIVDLIRHDLAGVAGVSRVRVPKLMSLEEYETVFQLVSVIEGDLQPHVSGTAALAASLPPGSMTGAPKKRSCELLKEIERGQPRGLYSGVLGYFDVGGGGDFSVVIRTAFKWDDDGDVWRIGAGGAITALSEPEAEWEEMITKRESVLNSLS